MKKIIPVFVSDIEDCLFEVADFFGTQIKRTNDYTAQYQIFCNEEDYNDYLTTGSLLAMQKGNHDIIWVGRDGKKKHNMYDVAIEAKNALFRNEVLSDEKIAELEAADFSTKDWSQVNSAEFEL